jgi:hypothetical protein
MTPKKPVANPVLAAESMYYLNNFETALQWVGSRYADLLDEVETRFLDDFAGLPLEGRALLVRLIMRKGDVFRGSKIVYPEIGDIGTAFAPLIDMGWADPRPMLTITELFKLFTRPELADIFELLKSPMRKPDALNALRERNTRALTLDSWRGGSREEASRETVFRVTVAPLCARFRILFFGNFRQEWSEFVLANLGVLRYERVDFSPDSRAFQSRQDIENLYALYDCRRDFYDEVPPAEVLSRLPRAALGNEWLEARRAKLLFQLGQSFERSGDPGAAMELYRQSPHPGSRLRLIRLLELAARHLEARRLTVCALENPQSEAERQKLFRIRERLNRHLGQPEDALKRRRNRVFDRLDLTMPAPDPGTTVEYAVLAHLSRPESPVFYVENTLINSLFGLLFWDAIFASVRGAFYHPFQTGPADLYSPQFRVRRQMHFDTGFASLRGDAYRDVVKRNFLDKQGIQSPFVFWGALTESLLDLALDCIPSVHLQRCFDRLLLNLHENRSGLPDLIQFWPSTRRYRMIEVKGPGDRVQDNQLRWMEYCAEHQIPVAVCHARWAQPSRHFIQ